VSVTERTTPTARPENPESKFLKGGVGHPGLEHELVASNDRCPTRLEKVRERAPVAEKTLHYVEIHLVVGKDYGHADVMGRGYESAAVRLYRGSSASS
jgi:hypothetical protein